MAKGKKRHENVKAGAAQVAELGKGERRGFVMPGHNDDLEEVPGRKGFHRSEKADRK